MHSERQPAATPERPWAPKPSRTASDDHFVAASRCLVFHGLVAAAFFAYAYFYPQRQRLGQQRRAHSTIQATMVYAIPLPQQVKPVDNRPRHRDPIPAPPSAQGSAAPPPRPTAIEVSKTPPKKVAPKPTPRPPASAAHQAQPQRPPPARAPRSPHASIKTSTAPRPSPSRAAFGARFAYYVRQSAEGRSSGTPPYSTLAQGPPRLHHLLDRTRRHPLPRPGQTPSGAPTLDQAGTAPSSTSTPSALPANQQIHRVHLQLRQVTPSTSLSNF